MAEQIQELIDKINQEGVQKADQKAQEITESARQKAAGIIKEAESKAKQMINEAKGNIQKMEESSKVALQQASRDMMISLRNSIQETLKKVVLSEATAALSSENLLRLIEDIIKCSLQNDQASENIQIDIDSDNFNAVKDGIMAKLKTKLTEPFTMRSTDSIGKGFTISFDRGKSIFDFTDQSLADYLMVYLNPQIAALLKPEEKK